MTVQPLQGVRVVEFVHMVMGPSCGLVLAEQVRAHPLVLRRAVADGHEIALHGWDHTRLTTLPL